MNDIKILTIFIVQRIKRRIREPMQFKFLN